MRNIAMRIIASCLTFMAVVMCGCGSSSDGVYFNGTLTQGGAVAHADLEHRHSAGQNIENVEVCALGECSTTDGSGAWAFEAPDSFAGGTVEFTIKGHGLDTAQSVEVPAGVSEVFVHFQREGTNTVVVHHLMLDGERQ
jgi:uncharacterized membrane protein